MTGPISSYFDPNGNCTELEHIAEISWNYRNNISKATIIVRSGATDDAEYYIYDGSGNRVRKITVANDERIEKIYLGGVEIRRISSLDGSLKKLERYDHHVMDDTSRIAIVNHWTKDDLFRETDSSDDLNKNKIRYQYGNHLGSASLELNDTGELISYEEYFPYGGTSFVVGNSEKEVKLKEYRYTGKERDDATGLYYYGARYYACWIGRWLSTDPAGPVDGWNLYEYVRGNPVIYKDPTGMYKDDVFDPGPDYDYKNEKGQGGYVFADADITGSSIEQRMSEDFTESFKGKSGVEEVLDAPLGKAPMFMSETEVKAYTREIDNQATRMTVSTTDKTLKAANTGIEKETEGAVNIQGREIGHNEGKRGLNAPSSGITEGTLSAKVTEWQGYTYNRGTRYDCSGFVWDVLTGDRTRGNSTTLMSTYPQTTYNPDAYQIVYFANTRTYADGTTDMAHVGIVRGGTFTHFQNYPAGYMTVEDFGRRRSAYTNRGGTEPIFLQP